MVSNPVAASLMPCGTMMIILGDISGIQNYLFDVAEEGGGQVRAAKFLARVKKFVDLCRISERN